MRLVDAKINTTCKIVEMNIQDEKLKFRLMELGLVANCSVKIIKKSFLKQTLLISFDASCFTLKSDIAKQIQVIYA